MDKAKLLVLAEGALFAALAAVGLKGAALAGIAPLTSDQWVSLLEVATVAFVSKMVPHNLLERLLPSLFKPTP